MATGVRSFLFYNLSRIIYEISFLMTYIVYNQLLEGKRLEKEQEKGLKRREKG